MRSLGQEGLGSAEHFDYILKDNRESLEGFQQENGMTRFMFLEDAQAA